MSDDLDRQARPPESAPPESAPSPSAAAAAAAPPAVSRAMLLWVAAAVVVLSFAAAFLGARLAQSGDGDEVAATPAPTAAEADDAAYEEALEEILPAGSAVRAGTGVPEAGKGFEGDVYIDMSTSDVYLFQDGEWTIAGNIRASAAENLTGATGPEGAAGATGEQGAQGEQGEPGAPGTQVTLGVGAPDSAKCTTDGDIYVDTETVVFYSCTAGAWTRFGPPEAPAPPSEAPEQG